MKALMKGTNVQFFRKYQRPKQDTEAIMNELQDKELARLIGISENQINSFADFYQQVHKLKLPKGFSRYPNNQKTKVIYRNDVGQTQSYIHPRLNALKTLFYQILANNKTVYTFGTKQEKLLPYVQDRMMRNSIGINSKRREAQKVNLQRDENGKMVLSKLARIQPDVKSLISSRSYLLRLLVQKIYTKKEIRGRGKRANAYTTILNAYHAQMKNRQPDKDDQEQQTQLTLEAYESMFQKAASFYEQQFGNVDSIPREVMQSEQFMKGTPENIIRNCKILNIDQNSLQLYWLARMMDCLPLPPLWRLKLGSSYSQYIYQPNGTLFEIHPSYVYIIKQMNRFRSNFAKMNPLQQNYYTSMRQMIFFDYFQRSYVVDLYAAISKENAQTKGISTKKSRKLQKYGGVGSLVSSDWMIIEAVRNSDIRDLAYVLIDKLQQFWKNKNFTEQAYAPAISPYGEVLWSSNITGKCISYCPYRQQLTALISVQTQKLRQPQDKDIKPYLSQLTEDEYRIFADDLQQERLRFLRHYIAYESLSTIYPYETETVEDYYENHFTTVFDLEATLNDVGQELPLWLQKVHAKKMTQMYLNLLAYDQNNFEQLLKNFMEHAIESTKVHQPTRIEQVETGLVRIQTLSQLKDFIKEFNNLDAREERKRLLFQNDKDSQDDVFGSSISNIEIQQRKQEEQNGNQLHQSSDSLSKSSVDEDIPQIKILSSDSETQKQQSRQESPQQIIMEEPEERQQEIQYKGIIYYKDQNIQKLSDEELDQQLDNLIKKKLRKHKYKSSPVKTEQRKNMRLCQLDKEKLTREQKLNLITTNFMSLYTPYKTLKGLEIPEVIQRKISPYKYQRIPGTPNHFPDQTASYTPFQSEIGSYLNNDIIQDIEKWRSVNLNKNDELEQQEIVYNPEKKKQADDTHYTIILQPLKRVKPQIDKDPTLRHVSTLKKTGQLNDFRSTFNTLGQHGVLSKRGHENSISSSQTRLKISTHNSNQRKSIFNNQKVKSLSTQRLFKRNEDIELLNSTSKNKYLQKKLQLVQSIESMKTIKRPERTDMTLPFSRVCLDKTANHFLSSQALFKKGDLVTLEARKTLLIKNRGLATYLAKKY